MDTLSPSSPTVSKTFSPSGINAGGTALLTITIRNTHALVSATLTTLFTDLYPAGLVNAAPVSVMATGCIGGVTTATPNTGSLTLSLGTLIPQASICTLTVVVTSSIGGTVTNTIPAGSLTTSVGTNSSTVSAVFSVTPTVNLTVSKLVGSSTVAVGGTTSFTLVVTNAGPSTLTSAISDTLPSQFTSTLARVASSVNNSTSASTANFSLVAGVFYGSVTIASGGTVTVTIEVTALSVGSYTNTLTVLIPAGTSNTGQTSATVAGTVSSVPADMSASFAGFPASASVNTVVNGTANFVNINAAANATATTATFGLQLPAGLLAANVTVTSAVLGNGTYNAGTGRVTFASAPSVVNVTPSGTVSASISFLQTTTGVAGTGTTSAINDTNAGNNTNTFSVLQSSADMSVSFAGFPSNATVGTTVTGTVSFANISTTASSTATSVTVTLKLKPGLMTGSVTATSVILGIGVYNSVTGIVTFPTSPPNVTPGQTITASLTFIHTSTGVIGTATASALNDINSANNTATFNVAAGNNASLSGRVFLEVNRNKIFDEGVDLPLANFRVEVVKVSSTTTTIFGSAFTDASGQYRINNLPPGVGYSVRFFDGLGNSIFGTPFNQTAFTESGLNPSVGTNSLTAATTPQVAPLASQIDNITLYAGDNVWKQNLPLDPSGVVYDSVTRQPVVGATVRLIGPPGFTAANIVGGSDVRVTGANGIYQFFFQTVGPNAVSPAIGGEFRIVVTPPAEYLPPQANQGGVGADQGVYAAVAGTTSIQPNVNAPAVGVNGVTPVVGLSGGAGTQYFLRLNFSFVGFQEVIHNHIPLDRILVSGALLVSKTGDKTVAELGDSVQYTVRIRNTTLLPISVIKLNDLLPAGFRYILGTSRLGGVAIANPAGGVGRELTFDVGTIAGQATAELTYFVRLGVGSQQGDGINRAQTTAPVRSNVALFKVNVQGGVFSNEGCIIGKVYVDCDGNAVQNNSGGNRELGIPGVRLVMLDGTFILTDSEGKYSICGVQPQTHVVKIDRTTLPKGSRMVPSSNRNAGVGDSLFVDLKGGELARADFIEGSCSPEVVDQVKARRAQGGVISAEVEKKLPLKIENRPAEAARQILPETRQQDAASVKPAEAR